MEVKAGSGAGNAEVIDMAPVAPGDRIIVHATVVGGHAREGEVVDVRGADGGPPYTVRWSDTGEESLFFPGSDSEIHDGDLTDQTTMES